MAVFLVRARKFFVTSGKGVSELSLLNAFDAALVSVGIGQYNLVPVTSIIPKGAIRLRKARIAPGAVTFVVLAHAEGCAGETLSAAVADVERQARDRLDEMVRVRGISLKDVKVRAGSFVVEKGFGSVIAALVLIQ